MNLFWETGEYIRQHNSHGAPHSFIIGHNYFSDLTLKEKEHFFGYHEVPEQAKLEVAQLKNNYDNSIDWRKKGAVGPVRSQGRFCQADWALATTSALESAHFIAFGGEKL